MNAYEYYKAMAEKFEKEEVKQQYISPNGKNGARKDLHIDDGGHMDDWISGDKEDDVLNKGPAYKDVNYWYKQILMDVDFEYDYYELVPGHQGEIDATMEKKKTTGSTKYTYRLRNEGKAGNDYFLDEKGNYYTQAYSDYADVFEKLSTIDENKAPDLTGSYYWEHYESDTDKNTGITTSKMTGSGNATIRVTWLDDYSPGVTSGKKMEKYIAMVEQLKTISERAKEKAEAISKQIDMQSSSIITCTKYLDSMEANNNGYKFDPKITFNYDQDNYMSMMVSSRLALASEEGPTLNVLL